jgi:hypothetical protein
MQDTYNRLSIKLDFDPWRDKKYDCENRWFFSILIYVSYKINQ